MNPHEKVIARDRDHLLELIEETFETEGKRCDLNFIDVSQETDMHDLFAEQSFRGNISEWDVSHVTDMSGMFYGDGPIFNLDTGKEEERIPFDLGIGNWDVSNVTNMSYMFNGSNFNGDISRWNVSNVTEMACSWECSGSPVLQVTSAAGTCRMFEICESCFAVRSSMAMLTVGTSRM